MIEKFEIQSMILTAIVKYKVSENKCVDTEENIALLFKPIP